MVNGKERAELNTRTTGTKMVIGETLVTQQVMSRTDAKATAVHRYLTCDTTTADPQLASSPSTNPARVDLGQPWIVDIGKLANILATGTLPWIYKIENCNRESITFILGGLHEVLISVLRCHLNMTLEENHAGLLHRSNADRVTFYDAISEILDQKYCHVHPSCSTFTESDQGCLKRFCMSEGGVVLETVPASTQGAGD